MKQTVIAGWLAGMAPDLDVLIRSSDDALLALDYHRHFTHSIAFAPVGGLIVGLALSPLMKRTMGFGALYLSCFLGYLSHGLLDSFTSYGTSLYLPFSTERVAFNWISVIDPLFTLPLLILLAIAMLTKQRSWLWGGALWATLYLGAAGWQHQQALEATKQWVHSRGLQVERIVAKPSFANIILWRGLIDTGSHFQTLAIRLVPGQDPSITPGDRVTALRLETQAPAGSRLRRDLERFDHFSAGWLFSYPPAADSDDVFVGDFRYAIDPASARPLWGITYSPTKPQSGVDFVRLRQIDKSAREQFWSRLLGQTR
ncbi:inner membrane protein [Litorivivens lipolytica]|uniref:Inner membrane protein n=1 Tax=Litorivivens lipolytica TaxID=1524264 RepID=A0A7W4W6J3_9GAMM|nr:inner membrane protein [Litorivivens lipolytica]